MSTDRFRLDSHKLHYHPHRVAQLLAGIDAAPIYVEVSPIGTCQHRCSFCAVDYLGYVPNRIDVTTHAMVVSKMAALGVKSIMYAGEGEPLLHSNINQMIDDTCDVGIRVAMTTNGALLHKLNDLDRLDWIKVSLNAGTRETYAKVHGTKADDFDRVLDNLSDAVKRRTTCVIGAQMVLLPENQHEVETLKKIGKDIGLDYVVIKPYSQHSKSLTTQYANFKPAIPKGDDVLFVRKIAMETQVASYDKCYSTPHLWAYIQSNGGVYSCSAYLGDPRFLLGNINTESFEAIWHGEARARTIELMKTLDVRECRVNCRMSACNVYLDELINSKVPHVEFI